MRKFKFYLLGLSCCLFIIINSCSKDDLTLDEAPVSVKTTENSTARKGNTPAASGQGTIAWAGIDGKRHFSFHAKTAKDGTVKGSGQLTYTKGDLKVKFSIDCISVNGNVAVLSGKIISNSVNPGWAGFDCQFSVIDDGEGGKPNPDSMTPLITYIDGSIIDCFVAFPSTFYSPLLGGNVQVSE